jgi:hypothetical protein
MNTHKFLLLLAVTASAVTTAHAQSPLPPTRPSPGLAPTRITNEATSDTGTLLSKEMRWTSKIPLDKTYGELNDKQKAQLHSLYESMPPGDEPPFPLEGMKPVFNAIKAAQKKIMAKGVLNLAVTVGPDGIAKNVVDLGSTKNADMTEFAGTVLMMTKFKPAVCGGKPCESQFPLHLKLSGG